MHDTIELDDKSIPSPTRCVSHTTLRSSDIPCTNSTNLTYHDQLDMQRMGKKQELRRNFRSFSSIAFTSCVMGTWEVLLTANTEGLLLGGSAGLFWSLVWAYVGQMFVMLSLAEMSSIAPTAGGQYHWVSEFAPPKCQKILSYASGWLSTLALQSFTAVNCFLTARVILGMVVLRDEGFVVQQWHTTVLIIVTVLGLALFNLFAGKHLAVAESLFATFHFLAVIPIVVVMLVMTPHKKSAGDVFLTFGDKGSGWDSVSLAVMVGQVSSLFVVLGSDSAAHMSEEVSDAGLAVPRSMIWSFLLNIPLAFAVLIAYLFCIGDISEAVESPTGFAFMYVFRKAVGSTAGAVGLVYILLILNLFIATSVFAVTSRQLFAFARDNGMPASEWLAKVHVRYKVPQNSILATTMLTLVISLINIGSTAAFHAIVSLGVVALMATYAISIGCFLLRRLRRQHIPHARWSMGRAGAPVNVAALIYTAWAFFWSFWPSQRSPDPQTFNWAVLMFLLVMALACVEYVVHGRKHYKGPAAKVQNYQAFLDSPLFLNRPRS